MQRLPGGMVTLTPDDVRNARFSKAKRGKLGYDEYEVDVFLDRVEATLAGKDDLTAEDVLAARFTARKQRKRGYSADAVDDFLDEVALTLMRQAARAPHGTGRNAPAAPPTADARGPKQTPAPRGPGQSQQLPRRDETPSRQPRGRMRPAPTGDGASTPPPPSRPASAREVPPAPQQPSRYPKLEARDVQNVSFISPPPGEPAYDEDEVDAFIDRVMATLAGRDKLTAQDVLSVKFSPPRPGRRGYHEAGVSAFLVLVASSLKQLAGRPDTPRTAPVRAGSAPPRLTPEEIHNLQLHGPPLGERGYVEVEVDAFLDRIEATLAGRDTLTAQDVHDVRFHEVPPDQGGYDQNEVEALLDLVEERLGNPVAHRWHA